jgi:hypothetical protein
VEGPLTAAARELVTASLRPMSFVQTRWEYRTYSVFMSRGDAWLAGLNQLGEEGWEVCDDVTLFAQGGSQESPTLLLKRVKR